MKDSWLLFLEWEDCRLRHTLSTKAVSGCEKGGQSQGVRRGQSQGVRRGQSQGVRREGSLRV